MDIYIETKYKHKCTNIKNNECTNRNRNMQSRNKIRHWYKICSTIRMQIEVRYQVKLCRCSIILNNANDIPRIALFLVKRIVFFLVFKQQDITPFSHGVMYKFCHPRYNLSVVTLHQKYEFFIIIESQKYGNLSPTSVKRSRRSTSNIWQRVVKCISSSTSRHMWYKRHSSGVTGFV